MTGLEPREDQVVREAVDAYLDGHLDVVLEGEMIFETKNSRYRLMDGTLFSAPDSSLVGAELVGWLIDGPRPVVESAWQPSSRAVLVDRTRGRHIIVTSPTRMVKVERGTTGSGMIQAGSAPPPSTPVPAAPPTVRAASPQPPPVTSIPRPLPVPARLPASPRPAPLHLPPRPVGQPAPSPPPRAVAYASPLPFPSPPPRRGYVLPKVQPPPARSTYTQPLEEAEDLEVTEAFERPLPLVRRTLVSAEAPSLPRSIQRGALLR